jgi:hypothetical protein
VEEEAKGEAGEGVVVGMDLEAMKRRMMTKTKKKRRQE